MWFALEPLMLRHVGPSAPVTAPLFLRVSGDHGNIMLVRRYGTPTLGCVVFFPGQHGDLAKYKRNLSPAFVAEGIAVLAVAYPGQDGAPGALHHLSEIMPLAAQIAVAAQAACPSHRVLLHGRSLGSMVAACAASRSHSTGVILESAAPSFSSAIRLRLKARWYLAPLGLLPVSRLLPHDYSLAEALSSTQDMPVVVFQGTADRETPLADLRADDVPGNLQLVVVPGGAHSTTYFLARDRIIHTALSMLRARRARPILARLPGSSR